MKKYTAALLALLLLTTTLPALASSQGASPADIALWQSQAPAPCGEFQKIITVLTPEAATDTIHRRLASSQRGAIIDNTPRFLPIRMTAAEFWATLIPGKYTHMINLQTNPDGLTLRIAADDRLAIWAGNRIFEMLEHTDAIFNISAYNPATDDFAINSTTRTSLDDIITTDHSMGWATWTRIY